MKLDEMTPEQIEDHAREQGWKPEEEWKGEPPKRGFVSAEEFLRAGDESLPLVTKRAEELQNDNESLRKEIDNLKSQMGRFTDFQNQAQRNLKVQLEQKKKERDDAIAALQKQRAQAISDADGEKVVETEKKIAQLQSQPIDDGPPPPVANWLKENPWYENDADMRDVANGISLRLKEEHPEMVGPEHLNELSKRVKQLMPHKFKNPRRETGDGIEPPRRQAPRGKKTWDNLPPDAKAAYEDYKALQATIGRDYTKEQYLASYEWDE